MFRRVKINLHPVFIVAGYVVVFLTFYLYLYFAWFVCIPDEWRGQSYATKSKIYQLDFVLWATSSLALSGKPFEAYDVGRLASLEQEISGKTDSQLPWFYPPTFMVMIAPLSLLSYPVSLAVWLASTLVCYLLVLRTINGHLLTPVLALAFPGIAVNFFSAQNGFLTGALMGGSLLLLNHAPIIAGILLALLSYKPHLACLAFVAFLAGRHWKALISSIVSLACLVLLSIVVFGYQPWISLLS